MSDKNIFVSENGIKRLTENTWLFIRQKTTLQQTIVATSGHGGPIRGITSLNLSNLVIIMHIYSQKIPGYFILVVIPSHVVCVLWTCKAIYIPWYEATTYQPFFNRFFLIIVHSYFGPESPLHQHYIISFAVACHFHVIRSWLPRSGLGHYL